MTEALAPPTPADKPLSHRELEVAQLAGRGSATNRSPAPC